MEFLTRAHLSSEPTELELANQHVAYEAACEGMVLLKNDGALPFTTRNVALYGPGASRTIKGGTGSGEVNERHSVSLLEGMENRGFTILSRQWIEDYEAYYEQAFADYRAEKYKRIDLLKPGAIMDMLFDNFRLPAGPEIVGVCDTDSCVYVLSRQAGEGGDRKAEPGDFYLTDREKADIRFCAQHYEKFVLVINCGSSMDMGFLREIDGINAILYICQPGTQGGNAVADILSGAVTPSGKLTDTWANSYDDIPFAQEYSHLNGNVKEEFYKEGIYVGYRYFDSFGVEPAFPFGFGLSYTDFSLECTEIQVQGREVEVLAKVTNTGDFAGKEVAQLYLSAPEGQLHKEYQQLATFAKTEKLPPGQTETLTLRFDLGDFASFRESDNCFVLEKGDYVLRLGNSSRNTTPICAVSLSEDVIVSRHQAICPVQTPIQELEAPAREAAEFVHLRRYEMDPTAFQTRVHTYETPGLCCDKRVRRFLKGLSLTEMVDIVVGAGQFGGKHFFELPGSVGNTTSKLWKKGLANATLCDGPAGLRVQSKSTVTASGTVKPVEMAMSVLNYLPEVVKKQLVGDPKTEIPLYQYTTAFPVANCLAQSWNTALMERIGNAIFGEMKEFGCTFWLAPAMNIHRNPLCGRNFEYLSEDPVLTGAMAAAITRGVQREKGYYVTIKHFACNNQEDNRTHSNSRVSQRALREIYLRGFQMAVEQGGAKSVMTSYNKLNGVYTPNSYDLCTKVLRNEWGFDGVVMTDWYSTNPGQGTNAGCMAAGNDLIMPGMFINKHEILLSVAAGKLSKDDVRRCCGNVVKAIFDSEIQREYMD